MVEYTEKFITIFVATIMGLFAWWGKRNVEKINYLAENCITRKEHNSEMKALHEKIDHGLERIYDKIDKGN